MSQATHVNSTSAPVASSRRRFLTVAAAASAVGAGSLAVAATPTTAHQCFAADDSGDGRFYDAVPLKCTSDDEAIEKTRRLVDGHDVELWQLDRKVAAFKSFPGRPNLKSGRPLGTLR
jgi:hypothetical protein